MYRYKYERGTKLGCTCFAEVRVKLSVSTLLRLLSDMKLSRFAVTFTTCLLLVKMVTAKPEAAVPQNTKLKQTNAQKLNVISSTAKPEFVYKSVTDFTPIQSTQQQHLQYSIPQQQQQHVVIQQQHVLPQQHHVLTQHQHVIPQQHQIQLQKYLQQQVIQQPLRLQQVPVQHQHQILHPQQVAQQAQQTQNVVLPPLHPQTQQQILQFVQRALYTSQQHQQPAAMIIIAQPALMPANLVYSNPAQPQQQIQLFPSQTPARYPIPQQQQFVQQIRQPVAQESVVHNSAYQMVPVAVQYQPNFPIPANIPVSASLPAPGQVPSTRILPTQPQANNNQQKTYELDQIAKIAQVAAQKFLNSNHYPTQNGEQRHLGQSGEPVGSLPPIITGLENFSPEQQAKIKEQLSAHFGAPLLPLQLDKNIQSQIQNAQQPEKYSSSGNEATETAKPFVPSVEFKNGNNNAADSQSSYTKKQN